MAGQVLLREEDRHPAGALWKNMLREAKRKKNTGTDLREQLCDSLIFVLFAAAGISIMLHGTVTLWIILAVVAMNAVVGVIQEGKAEKALESLEKDDKAGSGCDPWRQGDDSARRGNCRGSGGSGCRTSGACRSSVLFRGKP